MKSLLFALTIIFFSIAALHAQSGREVHGTVIDTTKQSLPGTNITLTSDQHDSTTTIADLKGRFVFPSVKGNKVTIVVSSIGYQSLKRHYTLANDNTPADLGTIILQVQSNMLNQVTIVGWYQ